MTKARYIHQFLNVGEEVATEALKKKNYHVDSAIGELKDWLYEFYQEMLIGSTSKDGVTIYFVDGRTLHYQQAVCLHFLSASADHRLAMLQGEMISRPLIEFLSIFLNISYQKAATALMFAKGRPFEAIKLLSISNELSELI